MNIPHSNEGIGLPVCVTGAGGYIGSWLVKTLLENGYTVHATLRDPHNPSKNSSLLSLSGAQERLRLFRADLCEEGSFDSAIHGCRGVFHVATPTDFGSQDPEREVIETAVRGTLNVLKSCLATKSVRRVVYTSSSSAASFPEKPVEIIDESCWSSVDLIRQNKPPGWMYYVSKTLADQAALQFAKENKMEVVSIVPVTVVGPWLTTTIPSSVDVTISPITGNTQWQGLLKSIVTSFVHIEDVCKAHLFLMEQPTVGERYICSSHSTTLSGFVDFICKRYPEYKIDFQLDNAESDGGVITMSSKKLLDLGFTYIYDIGDMIDQTLQHFYKLDISIK
eukprot:PITA_21313